MHVARDTKDTERRKRLLSWQGFLTVSLKMMASVFTAQSTDRGPRPLSLSELSPTQAIQLSIN